MSWIGKALLACGGLGLIAVILVWIAMMNGPDD
jgi:plastocyanin domain-containing protein